MLINWLSTSSRLEKPYSFQVIDVEEYTSREESVLTYLGSEILEQYRSIEHLKKTFSKEDASKLREYLANYALPSDVNIQAKNVRQGDFGEILTTLIIENFRNLKVPISKLRYKFNKDRSVFCTDLISHNNGGTITDLKYYEIKTRTSKNVNDVGKEAYEGLLKDENKPTEAIADFLSRHYHELAEVSHNSGGNADNYYDLAKQFSDIVINPNNYNRSFEIVLIIEKAYFNDKILDNLNNIATQLTPLEVTIILINSLDELVVQSFDKAIENAVAYVYGTVISPPNAVPVIMP